MIDSASFPAASDRSRSPVMALILAALEVAPERECIAFARLYDEWRSLPPDRKAILAKTLFPDLSDAGVAAMAGVSRRHLYRLACYQAFKPRLADFKRSRPRSDFSKRRRSSTNPSDPFA